MYMSRLAALKEFTFMKVLRENGLPTPEPIAQNRHTIVMSLIDAFPLRQISSVPDPAGLYAELLELIVRLAGFGLIHGDFNEFNILIKEDAQSSSSDPDAPPKITLTPIIIDFPQMVSISHPDAQFYFDRDVACIKRFFERRFHFTSDDPGPFFEDGTSKVTKRLDVEAEASGFSKKMARELEKYMKDVGVDGDAGAEGGVDAEEDEDDEADEDDEDANQDSKETRMHGAQNSVDVGDQLHPEEAQGIESLPTNADPSVPDAHLNATFTVLDIKDFDESVGAPPVAPSVAGSVAPSARMASKKAAGWAI